MAEPVIIGGVRTPFARSGGTLRATTPLQLLSHTLNGLVDRVGLNSARLDDVLVGCVTPIAEQGANIGRLAVLNAGFPVHVPATTVNRMCGSSQQTIHFAAQAIAAGDASYAIGCGVESMTRVPMASDFKKDDGTLVVEDVSGHDLIHQGHSAELIAEKWQITRREVDEFAMESHRRAQAAKDQDRNAELLPIEGLDKQSRPCLLTYDDGIRAVVDPVKIASLPTVFRPDGDGVVTAANASQISDGASAVLVADRDVAVAEGFQPLARFLARVAVGDNPTEQLTAVIPATRIAMERAGVALTDIDWIEINEAFATVVLSWGRELEPDWNKVNPWGGAIAHGHPLGATGAGLMSKMLSGLTASNGQLGLQVMCIGHGMATATIIERL
jgi:acetyl-CoA acetyltransferase family protein